jgi:tRNA threonylcarbamoyl adenosine modification protein YeaZ
MKKDLILAIETGVGGGSLSLLRNESEIDFWKGEAHISRSEDLLSNISVLLSKNKLSTREIKKIAVSRGPGSYTGIRIGLATAKGLQKALGCDLCGISVLESMIIQTTSSGVKIAAFIQGKKDVCWQRFEIDDLGAIQSKNFPELNSVKDFIKRLECETHTEFILSADLIDAFKKFETRIDFGNVKISEGNLARYIGLKSEQGFSTGEILPIYAKQDGGI